MIRTRSGFRHARQHGSAVVLLLALMACGPDPTEQPRAENSAVVFMYHRFGEDAYPSTSIGRTQFEAHLELLQSEGFTVVPLSDVLAAVQGGAALPSRAVAITVDDAYRSVYEVAWPMLEARGLPFTVFVATDAVDQSLPDFMSWDQMREMELGGASFANHGASHASVVVRDDGESEAEWLARVRADIERGARRLGEELSPLPDAFAYPYGEFDTATGDLLTRMGYVSFGQHSGAIGPLSDRRALPRYPMAEAYADIGEFRTKALSQPMPVREVLPWEPVTADRQPTIEVRIGDTDAALDRLACFVGGQGPVDVEWLEPESRFRVGPSRSFGAGRQRVNCTAPLDDGRFLWFSHQWIVRP